MNLPQNGLSTRAFEQETLLPLREKVRACPEYAEGMRGVSPSPSPSPIKGEGFGDSYMNQLSHREGG